MSDRLAHQVRPTRFIAYIYHSLPIIVHSLIEVALSQVESYN